MTFPGKPAGRFSDGRVLTDFIASFLGIPSPVPYELRKIGDQQLQYGMNFAYGGTGVFNTLASEPNMTTQINSFQRQLEDEVYTKRDLNSSIALVSVAGNDYATYMAGNAAQQQSVQVFTRSLISQLALNLESIHGFGIRKIAVTSIGPLGCFPPFTASSSYKKCSLVENSIAQFHNKILEQAVQKLNKDRNGSVFVFIDLYKGFYSAFKTPKNFPGSLKLENPLKPCCMGMSSGNSCGSVDENGEKKYTVCENAGMAFFWDMVHPSQNGWHAVYSAISSSLHQKLY